MFNKPLINGNISEVFSSIQGEGLYIGARQIFIRFYGCNVDCVFCDTRPATYKQYTVSGLYSLISRYKVNYHSISFTGGEPLLQNDFLRGIFARLKKNGVKIYLETNGILYKELKDVIEYADIIAMDIKLPSSGRHKNYWQEHEKFLKIAAQKEVFIKCVICLSTRTSDIKKAAELLKKAGKNIPLVIQPNTRQLGKPLIDKAMRYQDILLGAVSDVRIIPQVHKYLAVP